ncbi:MAG: glycosyltransferase family 4 protein [Candidatus Paceibacterota bacterium]|jgi:glycosyltransferase involved in cell wall biosynthesis
MKKKSYKILHITPHLGGGVGKVLLNYLISVKNDLTFEHIIACLDYANDESVKKADNFGFRLLGDMARKKQKLLAMLTKADVVLIHWWNHPLLYDLLVRTQFPPCRLIIWSHISGFHPPYVFTEKILCYPDVFVFTTPVSMKAKEVVKLTKGQKKNLRVIWSTGGVEHVRSVEPEKHTGFNVGYIGTVDYAKIHPDFLDICSKIDIPDVKFIVCGGSKEEEFRRHVRKLGIEKKFNFTGLVPDIKKYLSIFDVFGYPLAPYHYGTCDQVLQESMAAGIVPVVLNNQMESLMVKNGVTGIVAKNEREYVRSIERLYKDKVLRDRLSKNARAYAIKNFSVNKMIEDWNVIFKEVLRVPKTDKIWHMSKSNSTIMAKDVFLESLGDYDKEFAACCNAKNDNQAKIAMQKIKTMSKSANWQAKTKGSVQQYNTFFPGDPYLSKWSKLMKKNEN